jgi:hypothetical protein
LRRSNHSNLSTSQTTFALNNSLRVAVTVGSIILVVSVTIAVKVTEEIGAVLWAIRIKGSIFVSLGEAPLANALVAFHTQSVTVVLITLLSTTNLARDALSTGAVPADFIRVDIHLEGTVGVVVVSLVADNIGAINASARVFVKVRTHGALVGVEGTRSARAMCRLRQVTDPRFEIVVGAVANVRTRRTIGARDAGSVAEMVLALAGRALNRGAKVDTIAEAGKTEGVTHLKLSSTILHSRRAPLRDCVIVPARAIASSLGGRKFEDIGVIFLVGRIVPDTEAFFGSRGAALKGGGKQGAVSWFQTETWSRLGTDNLEDTGIFIDLVGTSTVRNGGVAPGAAGAVEFEGAVEA